MTLLFIYKKLLSLPILIPIEGAIRKILLSLSKTRKQNKLKRSQGKGNWAGFRSRSIKRETETGQRECRVAGSTRGDELHQIGMEQGTGGTWGQARKRRLGPLLGHRMR